MYLHIHWGRRVDFNQLEGSISTELGTLVGLTQLGLNNNILTGNLPTELGTLLELEHLRLDQNHFVGTIPTEFGYLRNLIQLRLDGEPIEKGTPTEDAISSKFVGTIPTELGNLVSLEVLYAHGNKLSGPIPSELGNLKNIIALYLYDNQLSGSIPVSLGKLYRLEELYLDGNFFSGAMPPSICNLRDGSAPVTVLAQGNTDSPSFGKLIKLTSDCRGTPPSVACMCCSKCYPSNAPTYLPDEAPTRLPEVLSGTASSGKIQPKKLTDLNENESYSATGTASSAEPIMPKNTEPTTTTTTTTTKPGLSELISFLVSVSRNNEAVLLDSESAQGKAARWLFGSNMYPNYDNAKKIQRYAMSTLYLSLGGHNWWMDEGWMDERMDECEWSDVTCDHLGHVTKLNLYDNLLAGTFPPEVALLKDGLEVLTLYSNNITVEDWTSLGKLVHLRELDLDDNNVHGSIPTELASLTNLEKLYLGHNDITGTIPAGVFIQMPNLKLLRVEHNNISGSIPPDVGLWGGGLLRQLRLEKNTITGTIPAAVPFARL